VFRLKNSDNHCCDAFSNFALLFYLSTPDLNMKKRTLLFSLLVFFFACKKSSNDPFYEPEPRSYNSIAVVRNNPGGTSSDIYRMSSVDLSLFTWYPFKRVTNIGESTQTILGSPCWGREGKIYFTSNHNGEPGKQIYVTDSSGGEIKRVTNSLDYEYSYLNYSWSRDRLVYVKKKLSTGETVIANSTANGTDEKIVTSAPNSIDPSFTPDGSEVVYASPELATSTSTTPNNIYVASLDGSAKWKHTATNNRIYSNPYFSPDGTSMVYVVSSRTYMALTDGSGEVEVAIRNASICGWSTKSNCLLLVSGNEVYLFKPGVFTTRLTATTPDCVDARFN
jgi:Tol biopolymer transport system component